MNSQIPVPASRPILHFAHANSYPAGTYGMFFAQLQAHYDVRALPLHAHNPHYPVDDGWRKLGKELGVELAQRYDAPVILVGHSMGGVAGCADCGRLACFGLASDQAAAL